MPTADAAGTKLVWKASGREVTETLSAATHENTRAAKVSVAVTSTVTPMVCVSLTSRDTYVYDLARHQV